jgi:hypothetical protein
MKCSTRRSPLWRADRERATRRSGNQPGHVEPRLPIGRDSRRQRHHASPSDYPIDRRPLVRSKVLDGLRATAGVAGVADVVVVAFSGVLWNPRVSANRGESGRTVSFNQASSSEQKANTLH